MKTFLRKIVYISFISLIACACSDEEVVSGYENVEEGTPVTLSIPYNVAVPKTISRATQEEEYKLYDLTLFIFNQDGKLKGYKRIEDGLAQNGEIGNISVKTTTGPSYLYAVANTHTTLYNTPNLPESEAQAENFTLEELKSKQFQRNKGINITDGRFVMSGTANDGNLCEITKSADGTGSISTNDKIIKLRRIVSKVKFRFGVNDKSKSFTLKKYDIYNIPQKGYLIEHDKATATSAIIGGDSYDNVTNLQNFSQDEKNVINVYLPENNESIVKNNTASSQADREANSYSGEQKTFTNAPAYATYIVAYADFTKEENGKIVRYADVNYTIHLGDFNERDWNNYDNERNSQYTYTITINDVNSIVVEAKKEGDPEPGAEGIVIDYTHGRSFLLDSHYETCVMQFRQSDIKTLKAKGKGYIFQVETIEGLSESFTVNSADWNESVLANVDYQWVTFAEGGFYSEKVGAEQPISYIETKGKTMYTVPALLKYLYSIAEDDTKWTGERQTLTFTCFVDENYYPQKKWNEYTNVNPRVLYIANNVTTSMDGHSIYAEVAYGVKQRSIQTFYNRSKAEDGTFIAYGCETIDETTPTPGEYVKRKVYNSNWDGRSTMINEISSHSGGKWEKFEQYINEAAMVCMSRNRDLNKDGVITKDEVRWYLPSYSQYSGLWLGERSIATEAALFTGSTQDLSLSGGTHGYMHYFTNTYDKETFWGEEGSTFGNVEGYINYVRCIRNLQTGTTGVEAPETSLSTEENTVIADKYYSYDNQTNTFNLENMDAKALRDNPQIQEFGEHHERQNNINAPYLSFVVDTKDLSATIEAVVEGKIDCKVRREATGENWRVPNQRELSLMVLEQEDLQLISSNPEGTYCKTKFSNKQYRYTYGYATNFRLYSMKGGTNGYKGQHGWIRCVRDKQNNK